MDIASFLNRRVSNFKRAKGNLRVKIHNRVKLSDTVTFFLNMIGETKGEVVVHRVIASHYNSAVLTCLPTIIFSASA